jgi:geranylgeranyl pyrophosphate synthase
LEYATRTAHRLKDEALARLCIFPDTGSRQALEAFAHFAVSRVK